CSILAHVSLSDTVRLKTSAPGRESRSTQKYPIRSNWNRLPGDADARLGSAWHERSTSSECGLTFSRNVWPSGAPSGSSTAKRRSYSRTSAGTACAADTQCSVAFTRRPSGASPPHVAGSYVQRSSAISPDASLTTTVHVMKYAHLRRTSLPGDSRKNFFGGSSRKSSRSTYST